MTDPASSDHRWPAPRGSSAGTALVDAQEYKPAIEAGLFTSRLRLRQWVDQDRGPFASINADPAVMEFFPGTLGRQASNGIVDRLQAHIQAVGWGMWAVELLETREFIGFVGLQAAPADPPFGSRVEIGWRLARAQWGKGYASEGAQCALGFAFGTLRLDEVISFAPVANGRSCAVMERLGMQCREPVFQHPALLHVPRLRDFRLYSLTASKWAAMRHEQS